MPRSTIGGDDPDHELPDAEKDRRERKLREEARDALANGKPKDCQKLNARARNISRRPSRRAEHH